MNDYDPDTFDRARLILGAFGLPESCLDDTTVGMWIAAEEAANKLPQPDLGPIGVAADRFMGDLPTGSEVAEALGAALGLAASTAGVAVAYCHKIQFYYMDGMGPNGPIRSHASFCVSLDTQRPHLTIPPSPNTGPFGVSLWIPFWLFLQEIKAANKARQPSGLKELTNDMDNPYSVGDILESKTGLLVQIVRLTDRAVFVRRIVRDDDSTLKMSGDPFRIPLVPFMDMGRPTLRPYPYDISRPI